MQYTITFLTIFYVFYSQYTEICENFKGEQPKDKDWALSTYLYRAINERKSSSSHEDALKDYWFLCRLKEEYYELEKAKGLPTRPVVSCLKSNVYTFMSDNYS